jgi:putative polyhydroxyalkanoate system protein
MADIELTRSHDRGLEGGREAVEQVARQLETDLGVTYEWDGDTLLFEGSGANGQINVDADTIEILIDLSAFLQPMQGRIEEEAAHYLDQYLEEA